MGLAPGQTDGFYELWQKNGQNVNSAFFEFCFYNQRRKGASKTANSQKLIINYTSRF